MWDEMHHALDGFLYNIYEEYEERVKSHVGSTK